MVIAIIALLVSILMPSLASARKLAKTAACQSNLKNNATALHIMASENPKNSIAPGIHYPSNPRTHTFTRPDGTTWDHLYGVWGWDWLTYGFVVDMRSYGLGADSHRCPSDPTSFGGNWVIQGENSGFWTAAEKADIKADPNFYSSYWVSTPLTTYPLTAAWGPPMSKEGLDTWKQPSRSFMLLCTTAPPRDDAVGPAAAGMNSSQMYYYYGSVHSKGTASKVDRSGGNGQRAFGMSAFIDGHVEAWSFERSIAIDNASGEYYPYGEDAMKNGPNLN